MLTDAIKRINEEISQNSYKKHGNEWNVVNQLIDIIAANPQNADIVLHDLDVEQMNINALVKNVTGKHIGDPVDVMKAICEFYKIPCPNELPPEYWRSHQSAILQSNAQKVRFSLSDLI